MAKTYQAGPSKHRNKLSKAYRFKKKIGIVKKPTGDNDLARDQAKKSRIIIRNLSFKTTEADLHNLYGSFGELEEVKLLKRPDGKLVGCGFVQFRNLEDASKAIFKTNKSEFLGRTISSEWAIPKSQFSENLKRENPVPEEVKDEGEQIQNSQGDVLVDDCGSQKISQRISENKRGSFSNKNKHTLSKAEQRKLYKLKKRQKRSRIVIRNLPFTITEEQLKGHFSKYGNIEEMKMLKKPDGKPTGCCFLQFDRVQSAAQAIHHENLKTPFGRAMVVDWAIAKDKYVKLDAEDGIKEENDISIVKEETNEEEVKIKEEEESDEDEIKQEDGSSEEDDDDEDDDDEAEAEAEAEEDEDEDRKRIMLKREADSESVASTSVPHPKRFSNDVSEGKTVFIKNVPFTAKNEDLKQCMEQFGPVYYALICMDPLTEHSKGTAFVKFVNVEDAEKCLAAGTELKLHDQILDPHKALHRKEVSEKNEDKKKNAKDSRNLYLVKEGVILASSPAAQDVSASDMARRLQLEKWKSQMLRNLSMFVSRVRLVIHNLPPSMDDSKLRQLFKKHSNPNAVITEARVMRDLRNVDANGLGKSKEHGFVSFTNHEDALKALRSINNNPNIFTKTKRPIVAFSIENRIMVNAKQKRVEKSRQSNPLYVDRKRKAEENEETPESPVKDSKESKKGSKRRKKPNAEFKGKMPNEEDVESFAGTTGKPGVTRAHGKFFLKKQATLHAENLKKQKKKAKSLKQLKSMKVEQAASRKEMKPKQGSQKLDADEVNFNRLVKSYKDKLSSAAAAKSKWYET